MAISNIDNVKTGIETDINNGVALIDGNTVRDNMVDSLETVNAASGILFEYVSSTAALSDGKFTMVESDGSTVTSDPADCEYFVFYENDLATANIEALIGLDDFAIYFRSTGGYNAMVNASNMIAQTATVLSCGIISPKTAGTISVDEVVKFEFLNKFSSGVSADLDAVMENGSIASVDSYISINAQNANNFDITTQQGDLNIGSFDGGSVTIESNGVGAHTNLNSDDGDVNISGYTSVDISSGSGAVNIQGSEAINAADAQTITGAKDFTTVPTVNGNNVQTSQYGTTANRPSSPVIGETYFDTDKGYRIDYNGTNWVNASGAIA